MQPEVIERELGISHADFWRLIDQALPAGTLERRPEGVVVHGTGWRVAIDLGPEQERRIANMAFPWTRLRIELAGLSAAERAALMQRFERVYQKGGG